MSLEPTTATRTPGSKGKWHLIALDDTYCNRYVRGDWDSKPIGEIPEADMCKACTEAIKPLDEREARLRNQAKKKSK